MPKTITSADLLSLVSKGASIERESPDPAPVEVNVDVDALVASIDALVAKRHDDMVAAIDRLTKAILDKPQPSPIDLSPLIKALRPQSEGKVPYDLQIERDQRGRATGARFTPVVGGGTREH